MAGPYFDSRNRNLLQDRIGYSYDGAVCNVPAIRKQRFKVRRQDLLAAAIDHIVAAATQKEALAFVKPAQIAGTASHRVRAGDTLSSISRRYRCQGAMALARANGLRKPYLIRPGQVLRLVGCRA